jgi:hypothetical protein
VEPELIRTYVDADGARGDDLKKFATMVLAWIVGVLVGAGIMVLFLNPGDKAYWSGVAGLAAMNLALLVAYWVRSDRPQRAHALWAMAAVLIIPALILTFSLGPADALIGLVGGLIGALIITWPYLAGKESAPRAGN